MYHSRREVSTQQHVAPGSRHAVKAMASRAVEQRTQTGIQSPPNLAFVDVVKRENGSIRKVVRQICRGVLEQPDQERGFSHDPERSVDKLC
jgi:hypothetical protein